MSEYKIRRLLAEIESSLNVTVSRITLEEAVNGRLPVILPRNEPMYIGYFDINELAKRVPREERKDILVPIIIVRRVDLGEGVFVVSERDRKAIKYLLGEDKRVLSKPEVQEIASLVPSLIHIMILGAEI